MSNFDKNNKARWMHLLFRYKQFKARLLCHNLVTNLVKKNVVLLIISLT